MPVVQLVDTIKERKQELGFTIERLSSESGVGTCSINCKDVNYSSISMLEVNFTVNKKVY